MEEIYKPIKYFENYSISNLGNIKNNQTNRIVGHSIIPNPENKLTVNHKNHAYDNRDEKPK